MNSIMTPQKKNIYYLAIGNLPLQLQKDVKNYLRACYFGAKVQTLRPISEHALIDYKRIEYFEETQ